MKINKMLSITTVIASGLAGCYSMGVGAAFATTPPPIHLGETKSVFLIADGKGQTINTRLDTVKEFLDNEKIVLKDKDNVSAKPDSKIIDKEFLIVTRIKEQTETKETKKVNFTTTKSKNPVTCNNDKDRTKIVTKGSQGVTKETIKKTFINDLLTKTNKIGEVTTKPVNQIVADCKPKDIPAKKNNDKLAATTNSPKNSTNTTSSAAPDTNTTNGVSSSSSSATMTSPKTYKIVLNNNSTASASSTSSPSTNSSDTSNDTTTIEITDNDVNALLHPSYSVQSSPDTIDVNTKVAWMKAAGIDPSDFAYANYIISHESSWRVDAQNPTSPAYGLPQCYYPTMMASEGSDWKTNPVTQLKWFQKYANERYHGIKNAYQYWITHNNY